MNKINLEKLKRIILQNAKVDFVLEDIKENTDLIKDLNYDSLAIVKLVVDIEEDFDIEIEDSMLVADLLSKYKKLEEYLSEKVEKDDES